MRNYYAMAHLQKLQKLANIKKIPICKQHAPTGQCLITPVLCVQLQRVIFKVRTLSPLSLLPNSDTDGLMNQDIVGVVSF